LRAGRLRGTAGLFISVLVLSLTVLAGVWIERSAILTEFRARAAVVPSIFGPFDADGGFRAIVRSLAQASIVSALGLVVIRQVRTRPQWAGAGAMIVMTADLAVANSHYVVTVPQVVLESKPEGLRIIENSERQSPSAGPFRIHRMPAWHPLGWQTTPS